ncbi:hypothetical protein AMS68_006360 [Peltaster fructicola]|uniref:Uncharacterized protein n=1 Tax=Peltaster fructicola TaxID=286661 RepID=A0A6H0Y1F9_9PEZI|nr:hypothetical protein AMS68_006360 [Peltaster fructicola]
MAPSGEARQPTKPKSLKDIPEIAGRYAKQYVSTESTAVRRDPKTFSLKPAGWKRWTTDRYMRFIDSLRANTNLLPFAEQEGLPLEEVQHLFTHVICDQLYNNAERVRQAAEARLVGHIKVLAESGTPCRTWTQKDVEGELMRVRVGELVLITPAGTQLTVERSELTEDDLTYLKGELTEPQWNVLHTVKAGPPKKAFPAAVEEAPLLVQQAAEVIEEKPKVSKAADPASKKRKIEASQEDIEQADAAKGKKRKIEASEGEVEQADATKGKDRTVEISGGEVKQADAAKKKKRFIEVSEEEVGRTDAAKVKKRKIEAAEEEVEQADAARRKKPKIEVVDLSD